MGDRSIGFPTDAVDNQGWKLYITSLVMIITAGLFVGVRCIMRYSIHKLGSDDIAVLVSFLAIHHGYGMHKSDLDKANIRIALKMFFIAQTPYKATVCLNKVAAILLYLRLFITKSFRLWSFGIMGVVLGYSIGGICATIWQCVPIRGAWDRSVEAKCIDSSKFWVAYAVLNVVTDVMVLGLPILPITRLQTSIREKLLLCSIFLFGGFVTITSILRVTSVSSSVKNKEDQTYNFIERGIWTLIEANFGVIATCLPVLRQPMGKLFPLVFRTRRRRSTYSSEANNHSNGYSLSDVSVSAPHLGIWMSAASRSKQVDSVRGTRIGSNRDSDEQHIIAESVPGRAAESRLTKCYPS